MNAPATTPSRASTSSPSAPGTLGVIARRLMPFLCLLYIVNYIDRTNVAMAKLQFMRDVHLSASAYGLGAGLFIGYFLFEIPSNLILERVGARRWIARIMISWGLVSAATMLVSGPWSFYSLRFLLGAAEAGFFPGIILYLTYFVPARHRAAITAAFFVSVALSGVIGSPLAGLLMKLDGVASLAGWQWLFLIEGVLPLLLGFAVFFLLPDGPADAGWLSDADKSWIATELAADARESSHASHQLATLRAALRSSRLWHLAAIYFMAVMGLYGLSFWAPTLIKNASPAASDLRVGCLAALPYLVGAVAMVIVARHSDRTGERRRHLAVWFLVAAAGIALVCLRPSSQIAVLPALCLAAAGVFAALGVFWALATSFLGAAAAAGGIATVNSIGNLAGFLAPFALGLAKDHFGSFSPGLLLVSSTLVLGSALVVVIPRPDRRAAA